MGNPVVHFEIIGHDPASLRSYYSQLFDWEFDTDSPVAPAISEEGNYGFVNAPTSAAGDDIGVPGGVGGGPGYPSHALFYVGVDDVEQALAAAERLGGTRILGPQKNPSGALVVGQFRDPEGHLVGVAGPR